MPTSPIEYERVVSLGYYLGTPVLVVTDGSDGWLTCLWPDSETVRKGRPFTYRKREWWRIPVGQVRVTLEFP